MTIGTAAEQAFLRDTLLIGQFELQPLWIGLADEAQEGSFTWVTGEPFAYSNWEIAEPNNSCGGQLEHYVAMNWHYSASPSFPFQRGSWNDTPLNGTEECNVLPFGLYHGIIEVVPEPSFLSLAAFGLLIAAFGFKQSKK